MRIDFGKTADDYGKFRVGFPKSFFESLGEKNIISGSEKAVDLGTGTGTVARGLAGMGCKVTGIDPSEDLLNQARQFAASENVDVNWRRATAEQTGLKSDLFDVAVAGQCWHWFEAEKAISEIKRILKAESTLIIAHFDWLDFGGNVAERTVELINEMNTRWTGIGCTGIYPEWFRHLAEYGFQDIRSYSYDEAVTYSHEAWRGRIRASAGVGGSMEPEMVEEFDLRLADLLAREFPEDPLKVPHRVFVVYGKPMQTTSLIAITKSDCVTKPA